MSKRQFLLRPAGPADAEAITSLEMDSALFEPRTFALPDYADFIKIWQQRLRWQYTVLLCLSLEPPVPEPLQHLLHPACGPAPLVPRTLTYGETARTVTGKEQGASADLVWLAGFIAVQKPVSSGFIAALYVHPDFFRQGCGRLLVESCASIVRSAGGRYLQLQAEKGNFGALKFYRDLNFTCASLKSAPHLIHCRKEL